MRSVRRPLTFRIRTSFWTSLLEFRFGNPTSTQERGTVLAQLDEDLDGMQAALVSARVRRNTLAPVSRLPTEILAEVFLIVRDKWEPSMRETQAIGGKKQYELAWIKVTFVCHRWREIALGTPGLWSAQMDCMDYPPSLIPSLLQRSANLPIRLAVDLDDVLRFTKEREKIIAIMSAWLPDTSYSRLRVLTIECSTNDYDRMTNLFTREMINLHELNLTIHASKRAHRVQVASLPPSFCANAPLMRLRLENCLPSSWQSPWFSPWLTHLSLICSKSMDTRLLPSPSQFNHLFTTMRSLEYISIGDIFPKVADQLEDTYPLLTPPSSLKHFQVLATTPDEDLVAFITHLSIPLDSALSMVLDGGISAMLDRTLFDSVVQHVYGASSSGRTSARELVVSRDVLATYATELPRFLCTTKSSLVQDGVPACTHFLLHNPSVPILEMGQSLISGLSLSTLQAITFGENVAETISHQGRWRVLLPAKAVSRLGIMADMCSPLLRLLCQYEPSSDDVRRFTLFPRLRRIHIHFKAWRGSVPTENSYIEFLSALRHLIVTRNLYGEPLQGLVVDKRVSGWGIWREMREVMTVDFDSWL
ncbi:hypothetical protein PENSPDRAFT_672110 [Peniophora sp. CONT]|nr:hypothetical protein PENSPDRAFT_672110 [Peniophora sp. CONT]